MPQQFFPHVSELIIFLVLLAALMVAEAVGWRIGQRSRVGADEAARSQVGALQAAVLGLLALLLGFTFSMAAERFDARRELILEEANSIETAHLRGDLLPEPARETFKSLLERYVGLRIEFYKAAADDAKRDAIEAEGDRIHAQLWPIAMDEARRNPSPTVATLIQVLNEMIDLHASRDAALGNHVPAFVIWMLMFVAVFSAAITGYSAGFANKHYRLPSALTLLLITAVTLVIIDLDRPRSGVVKSGEVAMLQLQQRMQRSHPHAR